MPVHAFLHTPATEGRAMKRQGPRETPDSTLADWGKTLPNPIRPLDSTLGISVVGFAVERPTAAAGRLDVAPFVHEHRNSDQFGDAADLQFLHQATAMFLDRLDAQAQLSRDDFVRVAGNDHPHDVVLAFR